MHSLPGSPGLHVGTSPKSGGGPQTPVSGGRAEMEPDYPDPPTSLHVPLCSSWVHDVPGLSVL